MADVFTKVQRSEIMSRIRGHGNKKTELALIAIFRKNGISGWRRRFNLFGKPDFVFPQHRLAVFVDGCFWHVCPNHGQIPRNSRPFWIRKLSANQARDKKVNRFLRKKGWRVVRIWEHELASSNSVCLRRLQRSMNLCINPQSR
jgi:DNA mismatch endonuclease (patch repair protein)